MKFPEFKRLDATKLRQLCESCKKPIASGQAGLGECCNCDRSDTEKDSDIASGADCNLTFPDLGPDMVILEFLGEGGMGRIFKVQSSSGGIFAVKVLKSELSEDREALKRFEQEVDAVSKLDHPNVIAVHRRGVATDGAPYLVMDYVEGDSLSVRLRKGAPVDAEILDLFFDLKAALACAHSKGIIHRDIKPSNVLLSESSGKVAAKLVDFGIAKLMPTESTGVRETHDLTKTGEIFGTPNYMSPEQCMGFRLDERSDIYSLGCLMYEVLHGKPPFQGENPIQVVVKQISDDPLSLVGSKDSDLVRGLESVVFKCLAKQPEDRYQSMASLENHLEKLRRGEKLSLVQSFKEPKAQLSRAQLGNLIGLSFFCVIYFFAYSQSGNTVCFLLPMVFSLAAAARLSQSGKRMLLPQPERKQWRNLGRIFVILMALSGAMVIITARGYLEWLPQPFQYLLVAVFAIHFLFFVVLIATIFGEFWFGKDQRVPMKVVARKMVFCAIPFAILVWFLVPGLLGKAATNLIIGPEYARREISRCLAPHWAESLCNTSMLLDRGGIDAYRAKAELLLQLKRPEEAVALLSQVVKQAPDPVPYQVSLTRAMALSDAGDRRSALQVVDKLLENRETWKVYELLGTRGRINFEHGELTTAEADLRKAIKAAGAWDNVSDYYVLLAASGYRSGPLAYASARSALTKAISQATYPNDKGTLFLKRSILNRLLHDPALEKKDLESALEELSIQDYQYKGLYLATQFAFSQRDDFIQQLLMRSYVAARTGDKAASEQYLKSAECLGGKKEDLLKSFADDFGVEIKW